MFHLVTFSHYHEMPSKDLASSLILPEVLELANDEECVVRTVAVETLAEVVPLLTHPEDLVPLLQKLYMEALQREDSFLPVMSKLLGKLCYLLKGVCVCVCVRDAFTLEYLL